MKNNICLTFHCLAEDNTKNVKVHPELFIALDELERLMLELQDRGYQFGLPFEANVNSEQPICAITFDDGYYNNSLFLKLAEKFHAPFILFASTFNIAEEIPFLWDICALKNRPHPGFFANYREYYTRLPLENWAELKTDIHRPFNKNELLEFAGNRFAHIGLHSHYHQPLVGGASRDYSSEIQRNRESLRAVQSVLLDDFAFPNGLFTLPGLRRALQMCKRVYTINGGKFEIGDRVIPRVSIVNPAFGGKLIDQIDKAMTPVARIKRRINTVRYSNRLLSLI